MAKKKAKKPTGPVCRHCNKPLERTSRSRHKIWYECNNLFCVTNQKEPVKVGGVVVTNKPKEPKELELTREALAAIADGKLTCPTGYHWGAHVNQACNCVSRRK